MPSRVGDVCASDSKSVPALVATDSISTRQGVSSSMIEERIDAL